MKIQRYTTSLVHLMLLLSVVLFVPEVALAHCDGIDGPVVKAGQKAFERGNVNLALIWVQKGDEPEIREAFHKAVRVAKLSPEARELAERYFLETLVRIHRGGEGEPYTGLKPAGRDLGPAIPAADKAINTSSLEPLLILFPASAHVGIRERFYAAIARKNYNTDDVKAGREYVKAYVGFIHYVEDIYRSAEKGSHAHAQAERPGAHTETGAMATQRETRGIQIMGIKIPQSLKAEHEELHSELAKAIAAGGRVGEAASEVARLLHPHFVKEEEYALPPLGLLRPLTERPVTPEMAKVIAMTDRLKAELPRMLEEHKAIVVALATMASAAKDEHKMQFVHFAEKLALHAQTEEEVLYPASILIGEYLKRRLEK